MNEVYAHLGVTPIINAAGTLTRFGGSTMPPEVMAALVAAGRSFVDMEELHLAAGRRIAALIGVEAAHVCAGAAAGITLMAAACMSGTARAMISQLPQTAGMKHRFVVQGAHRNPFDQAVRLAGGEFVEIAATWEALEEALRGGADSVAAVYYTCAWFCTGSALRLGRVAALAHAAGVPVIVDAAAELPPVHNLTRHIAEGADLVVFSGGKVLRGPQASGLILGRADLVEACRLNDNPFMGVGRPMKAGKEEIVALVAAVERYLATDHAAEMADWERRVTHVVEAVSGLPDVRAWRQLPHGDGQLIPHAAIAWDEQVVEVGYEEAVRQLLGGRPRVAVQLISPQRYGFGGYQTYEVRVHPHTLADGEEIIVAARLREVLQG
jgi:L-seryl-tRNA(Ser) seleniumtransferase